MLSYFKRLEVEYDEASNELIIPTFRQDLNRDADIAEEVAQVFNRLCMAQVMEETI